MKESRRRKIEMVNKKYKTGLMRISTTFTEYEDGKFFNSFTA